MKIINKIILGVVFSFLGYTNTSAMEFTEIRFNQDQFTRTDFLAKPNPATSTIDLFSGIEDDCKDKSLKLISFDAQHELEHTTINLYTSLNSEKNIDIIALQIKHVLDMISYDNYVFTCTQKKFDYEAAEKIAAFHACWLIKFRNASAKTAVDSASSEFFINKSMQASIMKIATSYEDFLIIDQFNGDIWARGEYVKINEKLHVGKESRAC